MGAPYIINQTDAPDWQHIVVCTHPDGRCRYLVIRNNRRWPHVMQLSERSTPLAAFGIVFWLSIGAIEGQQTHDSAATYADGEPRRWQAGKTDSMPLMAPDPKFWRLDPQVAPKLIKWIQFNPAQAQWAKVIPPVKEPSLIYELVDATDGEQYYPMGVFFDYEGALKAAEVHHPGRWEPILDTQAVAEIRARKVGISGGDYAVLWRGEWHYDYDAHEWKLVEQQTGTLEKPLPITRP